jgi:uncharacterized protein YndB with AHSA1/START domain/uncharacterized damage-inducible protein DinB
MARRKMPTEGLLEALLDSWHRNNIVLVNLLRALPEAALDTRPMAGSPSIAELFTHIHYVRLVFVLEDAPEFAREMPEREWMVERDRDRLALMLNDSAQAVRDAVKGRLAEGRGMNLHYDHPILMLQHLIWHEGYHHGQMKLALKLAGRPLTDEEAGPLTWGIWMSKKEGAKLRITVETLVKSDPLTVWETWNNPEDIRKWNAASDDWHTTRSAVDLREGGKFSARMEAKDGSAGFDFEGTYTRIVPRKVIEYRLGDAREVKIEFTEGPDGVFVRETFDAESENDPEHQRQGWQAILNNFARHVERRR